MEKYNNNSSQNGDSDKKNDKINNLFQQTHDNIFPLMNMNLDPSLEHKPILGTPFNSLSFMRNNNPLGPAETSISNEDHNLNYYQEYCRLFIANVVLTTQMKELVSEKNDLYTKLEQLEKKTDDYNMKLNESLSDRKKRMRRTAEEIDRHFKCNIDTCMKTYGSEGSLNQHIKLKHPDQYAIMAQNMIMNTSSLHSQDRTKEQDEEKEDFE